MQRPRTTLTGGKRGAVTLWLVYRPRAAGGRPLAGPKLPIGHFAIEAVN
jgi:hypothetical protein